ncbi:MAG TPA: ABC transporter permease [Thermoanaerobaculia bacterium]|nr:ABC transporter permease [Thermoanaerobaculia bacterium]
METLWNDVRFALRNLRSAPATTGAALLALALGIGANTAIFSVVNGVLIEPLPYDQPERLILVWEANPSAGFPRFSVSPPNFTDWKEQSRSFGQLAAMDTDQVTLTGRGEPEVLKAARVSAGFWEALRQRPAVGRAFRPEEDRPANRHVVVLSDGLFRRRFGSDSRIVGQGLLLDGESYTVVGIAPPRFDLPNKRDLWLPLALDLAKTSRGGHYLVVLGRLRDGVSLDRARAELTGLAANLERQYPASNTGWGVRLVPLQEQATADIRPALQVLLAAVSAVLLIACLNVANLLLARLAARDREMAVRAALGAGRWRLARQLLTESVLLALLGGALGLILAFWGTRALVALYADHIPRAEAIGIDGRVLAFTLGISLLTGLLFGLFPALHPPGGGGGRLNESLKEGGRAVAGGGRARLARQLLVLAEVALALVLLVGAGLLMKSFSRLRSIDPGFRPAGVLTMEIAPSELKLPDAARQTVFYRQLLERVRSLPGVQKAATAFPLPLGGNGFILTFSVAGRPEPPPNHEPSANVRIVSPDFFQALGVRLLKGRAFTEQDRPESVPVAVINHSMAEKIWPGEDPLGKRFTFGNPQKKDVKWLTVVGVAADVRHAQLSKEPGMEAYWSQLQDPERTATLVVRAAAEPERLAAPIRREIQAMDRDLPVFQVRTMEEIVSESLAQSRFSTVLLGLFAGLALVLASLGVYAVVSYSVSQRTHEIGIRMALGAHRENVLALVIRQGMTVVLAGIVLGLGGAFLATRELAGLVYGVSTKDPATFASVTVVLAFVALAANYLPARRATRVDPLVALRQE